MKTGAEIISCRKGHPGSGPCRLLSLNLIFPPCVLRKGCGIINQQPLQAVHKLRILQLAGKGCGAFHFLRRSLLLSSNPLAHPLLQQVYRDHPASAQFQHWKSMAVPKITVQTMAMPPPATLPGLHEAPQPEPGWSPASPAIAQRKG